MNISELLQTISITVIISAVVYGIIQGVHFISNHRHKKIEEYHKSFDTVVAQLSSDNKASQLSAAILLRRYFGTDQNKSNVDLRFETINVISALIRTLPTGILQKTLGDSLAYAKDLSMADLQKTNLQDVYLGNKEYQINMQNTDMFMADLSYALIENIQGQNAIFYHTILLNAQIKNSDFTNANFCGADLSNTRFKNVYLKGADFSNAINIPNEIVSALVNGICISDVPITTIPVKNGKTIFFSMPGNLSRYDEIITKNYRDDLLSRGYDVIYYQKDDYPEFGQFNKIRESIMKSSGMIAFGFKQLNIKEGIYYPETTSEIAFSQKWLSTPWNELEVGMGLMCNLPILLIKDPAINSGIFDEKLSECFIASIPSDYDCRRLGVNKEFNRWLEKI